MPGCGDLVNTIVNIEYECVLCFLQTLPPEELHKGPSTPVSSIPFYFRTEASPITVERSPERSKATNVVRPQPQHQPLDSSPRLDVHSAGSRGHSRDRSPMGKHGVCGLLLDYLCFKIGMYIVMRGLRLSVCGVIFWI